jgi:hypothetical protein
MLSSGEGPFQASWSSEKGAVGEESRAKINKSMRVGGEVRVRVTKQRGRVAGEEAL